ncbi:15753_t:CDS:1, partial [Dentiscutata heterogama]
DEEGFLTCYAPPQLRKIKLKRSRPSFQIIGGRDEIFNWLEEHGDVICEYNQEFDFQFNHHKRTDSRSKVNALELPILLFDLYYDKENDDDSSHQRSVIKKIFPFNGKRRMVMEVRPLIRGEEYEHPKNLFRRNTGVSGVKLRQILNVWTNSSSLQRQRDPRAA